MVIVFIILVFFQGSPPTDSSLRPRDRGMRGHSFLYSLQKTINFVRYIVIFSNSKRISVLEVLCLRLDLDRSLSV